MLCQQKLKCLYFRVFSFFQNQQNLLASGQRDKDIVYGWIKQVQTVFPMDNSHYTIVQLIQDLILLFFHIAMDTKILTDEEEKKLFEMVMNLTYK